MQRNHSWKIGTLGLTVAVAMLLSTAAFAGGWSVVVLDNAESFGAGNNLRADEPFTIGFTVLQHGRTPMEDLSPQITFTPANGGTTVEVTALAEGVPGHYTATILLASSGEWQWQIAAFGPPSVMAPLTVNPAVPPATTGVDQAFVGWAGILVTIIGLSFVLGAVRARRTIPSAR
ncbi:MAG: hypothetical protein HC822_08970 [Oscillochloris sp.]|nr:hypothetical protein [Oscillochloris sp.]